MLTNKFCSTTRKLLNAYQRKNVSFVRSIGTCDVELVLNRGRRFELTLGNMFFHQVI